MTRTASVLDSRHDRSGISPDIVRIGKDVIELLTSGMYASPITIYREYVQNAADGIDAFAAAQSSDKSSTGHVSIKIDHETRTTSIRDNGAAIPASDATEI